MWLGREAHVRLPKVWRDTGTWNDPVVSTGIVVGVAAWGGLGWWLEMPWLLLAALFLGPVSGVFLGIAAVSVLCRFFSDTKE
jgi:hypothetical protein